MPIPERILVIDDDSINNMLCKYIINEVLNNTVEIIAFAIPQRAVDYIKTEYSSKPVQTLVFLDINMPGLSGWDVLDELSRSKILINKYFRIFILSSSVDPNDKRRANISPLVNGFIEKPLEENIVKKTCGISV